MVGESRWVACVADRNSDYFERYENDVQSPSYAYGSRYKRTFCLPVSSLSLDAEHSRLTAAGLAPQPIKELTRDGARLARFFFVTDPDGYKIEVLERHGRYR